LLCSRLPVVTLPPMSYRLLHGARVLTSRAGFEARALLLRDGVIVDLLAPREADSLRKRDDVAAVDMAGSWIVPGLVDAHIHLVALALRSVRCDLSAAKSAPAIVAALQRFAATAPEDGVIMGVEWDESSWETTALVTREQLNTVSKERPVFARRVCGHVGVANSAMLALLEPSPQIDPESGRITERAVAAATAAAYPAPERIADGFTPAIGTLHSLGVTTVHDIIEPRHADAYARGLRRAPRPLRVHGYFHATPDAFESLAASMASAGSRFLAAGIKVYADGSIGGRTAAMHAPYADGDGCGELLVAPAELEATARRCAELEIGCAIHAIGDRTIAEVARAMAAAGGGERFRIEHAEFMGHEELDAVRDAGLVLSMQPNFVRNWGGEGGLYQRRLGPERWRRHNPFRTIVSAGIPLVFGSDGMPAGPLYGLRGAVHHPVAGESIDAATALSLCTEAPWRYGPHRAPGGRIERDLPADLTVLSGNPFIANLDGLSVRSTWVAGEQVYSGPSSLVSP